MNIADAIREEATKLIKRHQRYIADLHSSARRSQRETGLWVEPHVLTPSYWSLSDGFNPYKVRPKAEKIAKAIESRLRAGTYAPRPAVEHIVQKTDGTPRVTSVFQVADNAVSRLVFKALATKNATRLHPRCYAFRTELSRHDALFHAYSGIKEPLRVYVAEFDFSKFFDTLKHDYLFSTLDSEQFLSTKREREIIRAFLKTPTLPPAAYVSSTVQPRSEGIPQGTSISLFLANIAAYELDNELDKLGVGFARYADDTLIWSGTYDQISRAVERISSASAQMGVRVNLKKSPGISLLTREGEAAEIKSKTFVDFLGVSISRTNLSIKNTTVQKIKKHISYIIYRSLIQPIKHQKFQASRVLPPVDRSYVSALFRIRRYLYGGLSESKLRRHVSGLIPTTRFFGVLAGIPLVDNEAQLRALDGWLLHTAHRALALRKNLLTHTGLTLPRPHGLKKRKLINLRAKATDKKLLDLRLPSFVRMLKLLRRASDTFGPGVVAPPGAGWYSDS